MKSIINITLRNSVLITLTVLALNGCDSFVEPKYEPEFPWQSVSQMEMGVMAAYSTFWGGEWSDPVGIFTAYETLATDFGSPINDAAPDNEWPQWVARSHRQVSYESLNWSKNGFVRTFQSIACCNEALSFLENGDPKELFPKDPDTKLAEIPRAKAELYFWRGYAYYWLCMYFSPAYDAQGSNDDRVLPLKKDNENANNTYIGTTKEIWDFIIENLQQAKQLMPKSFHIPGRVDYYTVCGALARAYFYTGRFSEAEAECTEIISSGKYELSSDPIEPWQSQGGPLPDYESKENIWIHPSNAQGASSGTFTVFTRTSLYRGGDVKYGRGKDSECTWVGCRMSDAMAKRIGWIADDGKFSQTQLALDDKRYGVTYWRCEGFKPKAEVEAEVLATGDESVWDKYTYNFASQTHPYIYIDKFYRGEDARKSNWPLMRLPEFYLRRAAIRFEKGDTQGAAADLKVIRDRAGLPEIAASNLTAENIDCEFIIEMSGEGLYLAWLEALRRPILPGDRQGVANVNPPYTGWYWKIPVNEVNTNAGYNDIPDPNSK